MHTVVIIGTGFGGIAAAIALREAGVDDFVMLERRPFMGGTWLQNTYPGAAVDVQSPLYSLSSEPWDWTRMFAEQHELEAYTEHLISKHGLREQAVLEAAVTGVRWLEGEQVWLVATEAGEFRGRFVINASGPLSNPNIPDFPGRESFDGPQFHTNAWRHDVDLKGKRVGVIGSGASAAQVIPAIAPEVGELHVFQRTPHWVVPRPDHVFSPMERTALRNRWVQRGLRTAIYWALESRVIGFKYSRALLERRGRRPALQHLADQVPSDDLRAKLTPDYQLGCKRVIVSNTLYPALGRDNVTLHAGEEGIAALTPTGIDTTPGGHVELDAIVYATGFHAVEGVLTFPVTGAGGADLAERWRAYPRAYLGTVVPDFPNLFLLLGPNTGIGHTSALFIMESQLQYVIRCIQEVGRRNVAAVTVRAEAEEDYTRRIHEAMEQTVWKQGGCKSWYQSESGHVIAMFPGFSFTFWRWTRSFRPEHHAFS